MSELPATESSDPATAAIDGFDDLELARALISSHRAAHDAALGAADAVARAIALVARALEQGRRIVLIGAGTSGRLAVLDAAELQPTFGLEPGRVEARIAGGDAALRSAIEGAEDDPEAGARAVEDLAAGDVAIGLSASGGAPYVRAALRAARERGADTVAIVNAAGSLLAAEAECAIVLETGAEPIAGSTRMRAGTAQKIVLNAISTGAMIRLGKTYGNLMVDLRATNAKLHARSERLVHELVPDAGEPAALLAAAGGSVKRAVVMARRGVDAAEADRLLQAAHGRLRPVIDGG